MAEVSDRDMPLFVRVEGYKDVLKDLEAIRQILENMDESVQVLKKVQEVKEKSIKSFLENVDRLDDKLNSVNLELPELESMDMEEGIRTEPETRQEPERKERNPGTRKTSVQRTEAPEEESFQEDEVVESSINDLHSELKGLKDKLDNL